MLSTSRPFWLTMTCADSNDFVARLVAVVPPKFVTTVLIALEAEVPAAHEVPNVPRPSTANVSSMSISQVS